MGTLAIFYTACRLRTAVDEFGGLTLLSTPQIPTSYTITKDASSSMTYFSTVFKKETGKTFINYLTDYRMEEAVELLLTQNEKTYVIAEKVGYTDPNYFSYVFKKQFGMSPSKYKTSRMEAAQDA